MSTSLCCKVNKISRLGSVCKKVCFQACSSTAVSHSTDAEFSFNRGTTPRSECYVIVANPNVLLLFVYIGNLQPILIFTKQ